MATSRGYRPAKDLHYPQQGKRRYALRLIDATELERFEAERIHDLKHVSRSKCRRGFGSLRLYIEECIRAGTVYTLNSLEVARQFDRSYGRVRQILNMYGIYRRAIGRPKRIL